MAGLKSIPPGIDLNDLVRMHAPALADTSDPDPEMPCEFFDSRQSFLGLCQGNHYQFDTLRRAKHSSMMVLYHVHNPEEPAWVSTCNACHGEMEPGTGWRCTVCKDFDMCEMCYRTCGHVHSMRPNQRGGGDPANDEEQRKRTERLMVSAVINTAPAGGSRSTARVL